MVEKKRSTRRGVRTTIPGTLSGRDSYLLEDTKRMAREQRILEQQGHRRFSKVHAREHPNEDINTLQAGAALDDFAPGGLRQHPFLDRQTFDGVDPNVSPLPPENPEARREWDNKKRDQEREKQERLEHRLGLTHQPKFNPQPRGP